MIKTNPVNEIPPIDIGVNRKKKSVMMPKNVAQARCAKNTNKPWGHISGTPLPKPKPAAQSGVYNTDEINALGR